MRMLGVGIGDARLSRAVCLRSRVECAHPPNLVSANPFGSARHSFGAKVRSIGQYTSEHCRDIFWYVAGANMRELIRKAGPFMHFP